LDGARQLLAYADDVNLLGDNIASTNKNKETLTDASKEVGLEINVKKTKHTLLSRHHNAGQNKNTNSKQITRQCVTVQIFGDDNSK
jgi:hypothetical protein